jgi:hypothetical protein
MTESNLPAFRPYLPPEGLTFRTDGDAPLEDVSSDLCRIAAFLQRLDPSAKLSRFHDWWEHDGLHFPKGSTNYHGLFQHVATPRSLMESMTGDHRVFIGLSPEDRDWYLRFFADWDEHDTNLIGEYSISLAESLVQLFDNEVAASLRCPTIREDALAYFQRIEA